MGNAALMPDEPRHSGERKPDSGRSGISGDRVAQALALASMILIILFLATAIGVLITGVASKTGPRSVAEREILIASEQAEGATGIRLVPYAQALISSGDFRTAAVTIAEARGSLGATESPASIDLVEAKLFAAQKKYSQAASLADRSMKRYMADRDKRAKSAKTPEAAKKILPTDGYYDAALVKADALMKLNRPKEAVAAFDTYLLRNRTASDVLIERGNAKAALKDIAGAKKDFTAALKYVPYDKEAKAGLKKIGAAQ